MHYCHSNWALVFSGSKPLRFRGVGSNPGVFPADDVAFLFSLLTGSKLHSFRVFLINLGSHLFETDTFQFDRTVTRVIYVEAIIARRSTNC